MNRRADWRVCTLEEKNMRCLFVAALVLTLPSVAPAQDKNPPGKPPVLENVRLALDTGGHASPVLDLAFTPDGRKLLTLEDAEVHVWDIASGERERIWRLPTWGLTKLAVSADGQTAAVSALHWGSAKPGRWTEIWLLSIGSGATHKIEIDEIGYHLESLQFSPDGKRLAWSTWYQAGVMAQIFKKGNVTHLIKRPGQTGVARFNSNGTRLLVGGGRDWSQDQCQVYDITQKEAKSKGPLEIKSPLFHLEQSSRLGKPHHLWEAECAPDSSRFAAWHDAPQTAIHLWAADGSRIETAKGKPRTIRIGALSYVNLLRFIGPDRVLAVGMSDATTLKPCFVDLNTGAVTNQEFSIRMQEKLLLATTQDGSHLAVNSGPGFQVLVFDLKANKLLHRLGKPQLAPEAVAWGPDSRSIAWAFKRSEKGNWLWSNGLNLATLEPLNHAQVQEFRTTPKDVKGWRAVSEGASERADKKDGVTLLHRDQRVETEVRGPSGGAIFYTDNGEVLAVIREHWHETMHIVDTNTGKIRHPYVASGHQFSVSPDHKYLAVVKGEQAIEIHRIEGKPARLLNVLVFGHEWIAWTPQGYYASSLGGEKLMGWTIRKDFDTPLEFYPIDQFRKQLLRPDIITQVLEKGFINAAVKTANAVRNIETTKIHIEAPPAVALSVVDRSKLPTVKVQVTAISNGQPITALHVFIDGIPAAGGQLEFKDGRNSIKELLTMTLPGEKATAYNLSALASTRDLQYGYSENVEVPYINLARLPIMHVLCIGINDYRTPALRLQCARQDAEVLLESFRNCAQGGLFKNVVGKSLVDREANSKDIIAELDRLQKTVNENDLLVVFFAGHGVKDRNDFYLLTEESQSKDLAGTALAGTTLRQKLAGFRCQVLLLLDACHSAAFGEKAGTLKPATDDAVRNLGDVDVRVAVLTAARGYEKAQERNGRGLFTDAIVRALNREKNVPFNRYDNMLYIDQLASYTLHEVQRASGGEQHPYLELPRIVLPFPILKFAKAG